MKKLFKKLSEQLEVEEIKNRPLTDEEKKSAEEKLIYDNLVKETEEKIIDDEK